MSPSSNRVRSGIVIVSAAVVWQGLGTSMTGHLIRPELAVATVAVAFLLAALVGVFGWQIQSRGIRGDRGVKSLIQKTSVVRLVLLNLVTAGAFGLFYVAATMIAPTGASVLEVGVGPVVVTLVAAFTSRIPAGRWIIPVSVLLLSVATAYSAFKGNPSSQTETIAGVALCVLAGACAVGVLFVSASLARNGISSWEISALRFHLVWILGAVLAAPLMSNIDLSHSEALKVVAVAITCISGPILLLQWGITRIKPIHSALLLACLPAVVFSADIALGSSFSAYTIIGVAAIVLVSVGGTLRKR